MSQFQEQVDEALRQLKAIAEDAESKPAGPVVGVSNNGAAELRVAEDGAVSVRLTAGSMESAEAAVAEALTYLLSHFERNDDTPEVDLPDFQGELGKLTGEMSVRLQQMREELQERMRRAQQR